MTEDTTLCARALRQKERRHRNKVMRISEPPPPPIVPFCSCPRTMKIDGVKYEVLSPMSGGCMIHGERGELWHIEGVRDNDRRPGRATGNSRRGE